MSVSGLVEEKSHALTEDNDGTTDDDGIAPIHFFSVRVCALVPSAGS